MTEKPGESSWESVLAAGVAAQRLVPGCVAVGGTAAALYAHHRVSQDTDHLVSDLRSRFDQVRERIESEPGWQTARVQAPVLILGSLNGVEVGFRQARRLDRIETETVSTSAGPLVVPTLDEMIGMKAFMAYSRAATRDFLDLAALAEVGGDDAAVSALLKSDARYGHLQKNSVGMEIAKSLADPRPFDIDLIDLNDYKGLQARWRDWGVAADICRRIGRLLTDRLIEGT